MAVVSAGEAAQPTVVGRIVGHLDGLSRDGDHYLLSGWACQQGQVKSIAAQLFLAQPASNPTQLAPVLSETANLDNEQAVNEACQDHGGGKHRFLIVLPHGYGPDSPLAVHGLRILDGVPNDAVSGSGTKLPLLSGPIAPYPTLPSLAGAYRKLNHPGVFTSAAELKDLVSRINRPGSYSLHRFELLAAQIERDLAAGIDWDVTYSRADGGVYQYVFSYEPQDHHEAEIRAALTIPPDAKAPAGAAVVAARLSLYAVLIKMGAIAPAGAPGADPAAQLAKHILLAWADHGFRQPDGRFVTLASFTRDGHGRPNGGLGLALGRGVIYSVHAQDLLQSAGALSGDQVRRLNAFHGALFDLIRQSSNVLFAGVGFPYSECSRYTNLETHAVAGLLAIARLLDDEQRFNAIVNGGVNAVPALIPWKQLFDHIVYGQTDGPLPGCVNNLDPDSLTSLAHHHDYQTVAAAPGEIADRFRSANASQGIGYSMMTLERLIDSAEVLRVAGFDPYGYRGRHHQSLEMAMQYYACFAKGAGFNNIVTAANSGTCANAAQYYGKVVGGVDRMMLIGADRFAGNAAITALETAARGVASSGAFPNDAILFGKWRD
jgi:hypothetical protein